MHLPQPGERFLDRFVVEEEIGSGGFARVYRATDNAGRPVALKLLLPDVSDGTYSRDVTARFGREARTLSTLRDPHTVTMYDSGTAPDGLLFMVFELVPGMDLADLLEQRGSLPSDLAVHILRQVLLSLREAHAHGLLHRDIKPENIRVYESASDAFATKLLDFGIARHMTGSEHTKITQTGHLVGTPKYMSPEQLIDRPLGPSSDIYSVGLVMLECVVGRDAMHGSAWTDQLQRLHSGHLAGMPQLQHVDPNFLAVLNRMTDREQSNRYQSAEAVLRALDASQTVQRAMGSEVRHRPLPAAPQNQRKLRLALAALAVIAVVLGIVAVVLLLLKQEAPAPVTVIMRAPPSIINSVSPGEPAPAPEAEDTADMGVEPLPPAASGCGAAAKKGMTDGHMVVGLTSVDFVTYVPPSYTGHEEVPLLVLLQPDHTQPSVFLRMTRFDLVADKKDFIVIAPTVGERGAWTEDEHIDRVVAVIEETSSQYCIDRSRIFAVGHNNGGKGVQRLSCRGVLAAGATNSFRPRQDESWCPNDPSIPMLTLNPLHTGHMPLEGGMNCYGSTKLSLKQFDKYWRERNHCVGKPKPYLEHETSTCSTWACDREFVSCHIDGGLGWPGSSARFAADFKRCDGTPPDFPTEDVIWKFFEGVAAEPRE